MVWSYKRHYTDKTLKSIEKKYMNMRASGASELRKVSHSKTAISFNILLVLQILCLRNIYIQVSNNICIIFAYIAFPFYRLWYDAI